MTWHATCKGMLLAYSHAHARQRWHGCCKGMTLAYVRVGLVLAWFLQGSQQPATSRQHTWHGSCNARACVYLLYATGASWHGSCMGWNRLVAYGMDIACLCKSCSGTDLAVLGCVQLECMYCATNVQKG